jgi:hypothetical protein
MTCGGFLLIFQNNNMQTEDKKLTRLMGSLHKSLSKLADHFETSESAPDHALLIHLRYPFEEGFSDLCLRVEHWMQLANARLKGQPIIQYEDNFYPLDELLSANSAPDVEPLDPDDIEALKNLKVGEQVFIGMSNTLTRVA